MQSQAVSSLQVPLNYSLMYTKLSTLSLNYILSTLAFFSGSKS